MDYNKVIGGFMNALVLKIADIQDYVAQVAKLHDLKKVILFGSYANGNQTRESDIDLLVDFGIRKLTIYDIAGVKLDLEELTGKSVDVIATPVPKSSILEINKEILLYGE